MEFIHPLFPRNCGIRSGYTALTDRIPSIVCETRDLLPARFRGHFSHFSVFLPLEFLQHWSCQHSLLEIWACFSLHRASCPSSPSAGFTFLLIHCAAAWQVFFFPVSLRHQALFYLRAFLCALWHEILSSLLTHPLNFSLKTEMSFNFINHPCPI